MITFTQEHETVWRAVYENGVYIGMCIQDVDGFFYWWSNEELQGHWDQSVLKQIVDFLEYLNADWQKYIHEHT